MQDNKEKQEDGNTTDPLVTVALGDLEGTGLDTIPIAEKVAKIARKEEKEHGDDYDNLPSL